MSRPTNRTHYLKASGRTACGHPSSFFRVWQLVPSLADTTCLACLRLVREPWHGTSGGYVNHRCHCVPCTEANRVRMENWRADHWGMEPPKHNETGYNMYGCRCPVCSEDHRTRMAAYRERAWASSSRA